MSVKQHILHHIIYAYLNLDSLSLLENVALRRDVVLPFEQPGA